MCMPRINCEAGLQEEDPERQRPGQANPEGHDDARNGLESQDGGEGLECSGPASIITCRLWL